MSSVTENIKCLTREQKIVELVNYFSGQGTAVDINYILAIQAAFSDSALDAALLRVADISATDTALLKRVTGIVHSLLADRAMSAEQLAEVQQRIYNRASQCSPAT
jgi:hypothetical protein